MAGLKAVSWKSAWHSGADAAGAVLGLSIAGMLNHQALTELGLCCRARRGWALWCT